MRQVAEVMDQLWDFGAWETQQTHRSLVDYLLEETYELIDAIDRGDQDHIREELGDLLLQVLFHSRIAEAGGNFTLDDVAATLENKLRHRSPHLTNGALGSVAEQESAWHERKATEKSARESCLDGIATQLPSLALADKVVQRCMKAGMPEECIPDSLRAPPSELELRAAVMQFMNSVRAVERAVPGRRLSPEMWREGLAQP